MKKGLALALLAVAGIAAYVVVTDGGLPLGSKPGSGEEKEVARLERAFAEAHDQFQRASRAAAISGLDTTTEAEAARLEVERLRSELGRLETNLATREAKERARRLDAAMREFLGA